MKVMGLALRRGNLFYCVLSGRIQRDCQIVDFGRIPVLRTASIPRLMDWYESAFIDLLDRFSPDIIVSETRSLTKVEQVAFEQFPQGVLHLLCYKRQILIIDRPKEYATSVRKEMCRKRFPDIQLQLFDPELDAVIMAWHEFDLK